MKSIYDVVVIGAGFGDAKEKVIDRGKKQNEFVFLSVVRFFKDQGGPIWHHVYFGVCYH